MQTENQTVLVTGGTRGIGAAISKRFLKNGARVLAIYKKNDLAAFEFKESMLEQYRDRLLLLKFDVGDAIEVDRLFEKYRDHLSNLKVLVNNCGIRDDELVVQMSLQRFENVLRANLASTFLMSQKVLPFMLANRFGRIINISSVGGRYCFKGQANYAASKAAQIAFAKSLAKEVAKKGITVNNVAPGFILTELLNDLPLELMKDYKKSVPMKRFGSVEDIASAVEFLAGEKASYITGITLDVAGGL